VNDGPTYVARQLEVGGHVSEKNRKHPCDVLAGGRQLEGIGVEGVLNDSPGHVLVGSRLQTEGGIAITSTSSNEPQELTRGHNLSGSEKEMSIIQVSSGIRRHLLQSSNGSGADLDRYPTLEEHGSDQPTMGSQVPAMGSCKGLPARRVAEALPFGPSQVEKAR
jgi:hypothetical protein